MADAFDKIKLDAFDLTDIDAFDEVELDIEDKIVYSPELKELLKEEISKKVDSLPLGKMIGDIVEKQVSSQLQSKSYDSTIRKTETRLVEEIGKTKGELKEELVKVLSELRKKYADFRNILNSQEKYTFGGFAPPNPVNSANGTFLQNSNGTWAGLTWAVGGGSGSNPLYIGDPDTDGSWGLFNDGTNLIVKRRESGTWNTKGTFLS